MNGTEKQIEFATNLIDQLKAQIEKAVDYAKDRSSRGSMPEAYGAIYEAEKNNLFARLEQFNDAGQIINDLNRKIQVFVDSFCQIADAKYQGGEK